MRVSLQDKCTMCIAYRALLRKMMCEDKAYRALLRNFFTKEPYKPYPHTSFSAKEPYNPIRQMHNAHGYFGTGWRRLMGCLNLHVIFRKRTTNYRALLRKMTCEDKAFYEFTPPGIKTRIHILSLTLSLSLSLCIERESQREHVYVSLDTKAASISMSHVSI